MVGLARFGTFLSLCNHRGQNWHFQPTGPPDLCNIDSTGPTKLSLARRWPGSFNVKLCSINFAANISVFSSPEPKAQVSYFHSAPSVVRPSVNFYIFNFFSRTAWWILMKLGSDEVLMVPYKCCCFSARSAQGRIQGGAKIGHRGSLSSRIFFFRPEGYSDKPNA